MFSLSIISLVVSSLVAVISQDIKKVVALSTLSQLRLIIVSMSLGLYSLAIFHLISHAIFKSCLFLSVGAVIHLRGSRQDSRVSRGFSGYSVTRLMAVSLFCLSAAPFTSAYYTKESIIMIGIVSSYSLILIFRLVLRAIFTLIYSIKFIFSLFSSHYTVINLIDTINMHKFMIVLGVVRIISG